MKLLSRAEEMILLAILKLGENAYGVAIREWIQEETGVEWSFAAIYTPLDKMTRKRFVTKRKGTPSPERGGRRKIMYQITEEGLEALRDMKQVYNSVWSGLENFQE